MDRLGSNLVETKVYSKLLLGRWTNITEIVTTKIKVSHTCQSMARFRLILCVCLFATVWVFFLSFISLEGKFYTKGIFVQNSFQFLPFSSFLASR